MRHETYCRSGSAIGPHPGYTPSHAPDWSIEYIKFVYACYKTMQLSLGLKSTNCLKGIESTFDYYFNLYNFLFIYLSIWLYFNLVLFHLYKSLLSEYFFHVHISNETNTRIQNNKVATLR